MKILKQSGTVIWLILLYLIPVLIVTGLRFKASQIDNKTLDPLFTTRFYLTAVIADIGFGYYLSRLFFRFFKPAVWICSFIFWFIAFACLISFVLTHNLPNESIFITVFDTTWFHTLDFLQTIPFPVYVGTVFYWGIWLFLGIMTKTPETRKGDRAFYAGLFIVFSVFCFISQWEGSFFNNAVKARTVYSDLKKEIAALLQNEKQPAFYLESPEIPRTVIVVVGESANRRVFYDNLSDFKEKTAFLKNAPLLFENATTQSVSTAFVLKKILLPDDISLISVYRQAGFKTFWFSNHFKSGKHDNLIYALTRGIDDRRYFNYTKAAESYEYTSQRFDDVLLSPLEQALADPSPKKLIFLHLFGSHFPYNHRYPDAREELITEQYAASVRYTNTVLAEILKQAEKSGQNVALLYFSDHGTIPENPFQRPAAGNDMLNVPLFFWFSDQYRQRFPANTAKLPVCDLRPDTSKIAFLINYLSGIRITELPVSNDIKQCFSR